MVDALQTIDAFQAIPVCKEALRRHPDDSRLKLATAFAYIASRKNDQAKPLLDQLVAANNSDAMLALAFISKGAEATELMRKAGEGGNASGLMLYGMAQLFGQGVPKDETGGLSSLRRAA
jgi:TPR repeat protein